MRVRTIVMSGAAALVVCGCGSSGSKSASRPGPPNPITVSVYVTTANVAVSPDSFGAGPVRLTVANQARRAESLAISPAGGSRPLARTAPIPPQGTTQLSVTFRRGRYVVGTAVPHPRTDAQLARPAPLSGTTIHVGRPRPSSGGDLLAP